MRNLWNRKVYKMLFSEEISRKYAELRRLYLSNNVDVVMDFISGGILNFDDKVIDVGCGSGEDIYRLSNLGYKSLRGFDSSPTMVELAKDYVLGKAEIVQSEAEDLPCDDGSIDAVISRFCLNYVEEIDDVHSECFRCLRESGRYIILIPHPSFFNSSQIEGDPNHVVAMPFGDELQLIYKYRDLSEFLSRKFFEIFSVKEIRDFRLSDKNRPSALGIIAEKK